MAKKQTTIEKPFLYVPPKPIYFFKIGEKYYRRLQPVPYVYKIPKL